MPLIYPGDRVQRCVRVQDAVGVSARH